MRDGSHREVNGRRRRSSPGERSSPSLLLPVQADPSRSDLISTAIPLPPRCFLTIMAPPTAPAPTLFTADLPSDDEDGDEDFAPPSPTSSTTSSTAGTNPAKRRKTSHSPPPSSIDEGPKAFSYSDLVQTAATAGAPNGQGASTADAVTMVTFTRERNFAGEIVVSVPLSALCLADLHRALGGLASR